MSSLGVILDANVLFPASLRDTLLRAARADLYRLNLTDEICRNLIKTGRMSEFGASRFVNALKTSFPAAFVTGYHSLVTSMTNQIKDRHVLAAAVKAGAQIIVTKNLKDFPCSCLAPFDIEAQPPDDFLVHLYHFDSESVVKILIEQAGELRNPSKTVLEVLDVLALHAPVFVDLVRAHLSSITYPWSDI